MIREIQLVYIKKSIDIPVTPQWISILLMNSPKYSWTQKEQNEIWGTINLGKG